MKLTQEEFIEKCEKLGAFEYKKIYSRNDNQYDVICSWCVGDIINQSGWYQSGQTLSDGAPEPIFKEFNLILEHFFPNISIWTYFKLQNNLIKYKNMENGYLSKYFNLIDMYNYFRLNSETIYKNVIIYET